MDKVCGKNEVAASYTSMLLRPGLVVAYMLNDARYSQSFTCRNLLDLFCTRPVILVLD